MKKHNLPHSTTTFYSETRDYAPLNRIGQYTLIVCLTFLTCMINSYSQDFTTLERASSGPSSLDTNYSESFGLENDTGSADLISHSNLAATVELELQQTINPAKRITDPITPLLINGDNSLSNLNSTRTEIGSLPTQSVDGLTSEDTEDINITSPFLSDPIQIDSGFNPVLIDDFPTNNQPIRLTHFNDELLGLGPFTKAIDEEYSLLGPVIRNPILDLVGGSITPIMDQIVINGAEVVDQLGKWVPLDDEIVALSRRGHVEYDLRVPNNGMYLLKIDATQNVRESRRNIFKLLIYIDDAYVGRKYLTAEYGINGQVTCVTPWLTKADSHRLRIYWDNVYERTSLRIIKVTLQQTEDVANSVGGATGWVKTALTSLNLVDKAPSESITSPVCIEGLSRFLSTMEVTTSDDSSPIFPEPGVGHRWFANVPLSPMNPTLINTSFENGAYHVEKEIEWLPTNILESHDLTIRKGDALLLTAASSNTTFGSVTIEIIPETNLEVIQKVNFETVPEFNLNTDSDESPLELEPFSLQKTGFNQIQEFSELDRENVFQSNNLDLVQTLHPMYETSVQEPVPHIFDKVGVFEIVGTHSLLNSQSTGSIRVTVIGPPETTQSPAVWKDRERQWNWEGLPEQAVVEAAWPLTVKEIDAISEGGKSFTLNVERAERDPYLVARLGNDGPILSSVKVDAFWLRSGVEGRIRQIENTEEGGAVYAERIIAWGLPPTVDLCLEALTSGVYLGGEDLQLARVITSSDFNEFGEYPYELITVEEDLPSCHKLDVYQDDLYIGSRRKLF